MSNFDPTRAVHFLSLSATASPPSATRLLISHLRGQSNRHRPLYIEIRPGRPFWIARKSQRARGHRGRRGTPAAAWSPRPRKRRGTGESRPPLASPRSKELSCRCRSDGPSPYFCRRRLWRQNGSKNETDRNRGGGNKNKDTTGWRKYIYTCTLEKSYKEKERKQGKGGIR